MKRDFEKTSEKGRKIMAKHERTDIKTSELISLYLQAQNEIDGKQNAILTAFYAGVVIGSGVEKKRKR